MNFWPNLWENGLFLEKSLFFRKVGIAVKGKPQAPKCIFSSNTRKTPTLCQCEITVFFWSFFVFFSFHFTFRKRHFSEKDIFLTLDMKSLFCGVFLLFVGANLVLSSFYTSQNEVERKKDKKKTKKDKKSPLSHTGMRWVFFAYLTRIYI